MIQELRTEKRRNIQKELFHLSLLVMHCGSCKSLKKDRESRTSARVEGDWCLDARGGNNDRVDGLLGHAPVEHARANVHGPSRCYAAGNRRRSCQNLLLRSKELAPRVDGPLRVDAVGSEPGCGGRKDHARLRWGLTGRWLAEDSRRHRPRAATRCAWVGRSRVV